MKLQKIEQAIAELKDAIERCRSGGSFKGMTHVPFPQSEDDVDEFIHRRTNGWRITWLVVAMMKTVEAFEEAIETEKRQRSRGKK